MSCRPGPDLAPTSRVRILAAEPALDPPAAEALSHALGLLLAQFIREGRCSAGRAWTEAEGRFVILAWDGPALSGCSHDKINQVATLHETCYGVRLLTAPPIAIGPVDALRLVDRAGLKAAIGDGSADATTPVWPLTALDLSAWRAGPTALGGSPFARLLPPPA